MSDANPKSSMLADVAMGAMSAVGTVLGGVAFAALIFTGELAGALPVGILMLLLGASVVGVVVGRLSGYAVHVFGPQDKPAAVLAAAAGSLSATMATSPDRLLPTVIALIALSSGLYGAFLYLIGRFRLGRLTQFVPYPVIGGFLVGTGWLLLDAAFGVLTGHRLDLAGVPHLLTPEVLLRWVPALVVAATAYVLVRRIKHALLLPGTLALFAGAFYAVVLGTGADLDVLRQEGWLFGPFSDAGPFTQLAGLRPADVDFIAIMGEGGTIAAALLLSTLAALLNLTSLEIGTGSDADLDHELRVTGIANLANALVGGLISYTVVGASVMYTRSGASSRWVSYIKSILCVLIALFGIGVIAFVPKMVLGALVFLMALGFLVEWLYLGRRRVAPTEYAIILVIVGCVIVVGFLEGIAVGVLISVLSFIFNYSRVKVVRSELSGSHHRSDVERSPGESDVLDAEGDRVRILLLSGYIFFGTASSLLNLIKERLAREARIDTIVLDFRQVSGVDASATYAFVKLRQLAERSGATLVLVGIETAILSRFEGGGALSGESVKVFASSSDGLEWVEERILEGAAAEDDQLDVREHLRALIPAVDAAEIDALVDELEPLELEAGERLFAEGDESGDVYFVQSGAVVILKVGADGAKRRIRKLGRGTILGEMALYRGSRRSATVEASEPCVVYRLTGDRLETLERERPRLAAAFHRVLGRSMADRIEHLNAEVSSLLG